MTMENWATLYAYAKRLHPALRTTEDYLDIAYHCEDAFGSRPANSVIWRHFRAFDKDLPFPRKGGGGGSENAQSGEFARGWLTPKEIVDTYYIYNQLRPVGCKDGIKYHYVFRDSAQLLRHINGRLGSDLCLDELRGAIDDFFASCPACAEEAEREMSRNVKAFRKREL